MRILVLEDNTKHLGDAKAIAAALNGCHVDFATSQEEADALVKANTYDTAILDVFYPATAGGSAESFDNAVAFSKRLTDAGIHHVFNTSGNHHGMKYDDFCWKTPVAIHNDDKYHFLTYGMIIEAYPEDSDGDKDTKQWQAAFRYVILVHEMVKLEDKGNSLIESVLSEDKYKSQLLRGFPYGEYGKATERFETAARVSEPIAKIFSRYGV